MYNIGDRVTHTHYGHGTVLAITTLSFGIGFDNGNGLFHELGGLCEDGYGYFILKKDPMLTLLEELVPYDPLQQGDTEDDI